MVTFFDPGPELDGAGGQRLERALGHALPGDYGAFLRSHNGGRPEPCYVPIPDFPGGIVDVQVLLGWGAKPQSSDIRWALPEVRARFPDDTLLPIAWDSSGNLFVLRFDDGRATAVEYADLLARPAEFHFVALSFTAFVNSLRSVPYS
ncbi:hypothetical protein ASC89_11785 [Devosia sp. Root413D1]|uniref:SMI1/KNR4 family protein n=1 Tax=Devosia sp. Root413D1 TaxID=1736531 RepID=UPI0006FC5A63|nr:hypothetical protein ASC89_11785 [Devosia sp. Root413D1]